MGRTETEPGSARVDYVPDLSKNSDLPLQSSVGVLNYASIVSVSKVVCYDRENRVRLEKDADYNYARIGSMLAANTPGYSTVPLRFLAILSALSRLFRLPQAHGDEVAE